jgi:AraC-like DNA-binding protein
MRLKINIDKLRELMKDFYILTNIKIAIFDVEYNEVLSYPKDHCEFCKLIRGINKIKQQCLLSDAYAYKYCKKTKKTLVYHCHVNLVEVMAPLLHNGVIIGYIMFGQITDIKDKAEFKENILSACANYDISSDILLSSISKIRYRSTEQILATAKILEACTYYILLNDLISLEKEQFIYKLNDYIDEHIIETIPVQNLCDEFNISRTKLYEMSKQFLGMGIADYIKYYRIERAKHLFKETQVSVTEVSELVGFQNYNYFCHVFKKVAGVSASVYRKT